MRDSNQLLQFAEYHRKDVSTGHLEEDADERKDWN
jgi:hypothetical protein